MIKYLGQSGLTSQIPEKVWLRTKPCLEILCTQESFSPIYSKSNQTKANQPQKKMYQFRCITCPLPLVCANLLSWFCLAWSQTCAKSGTRRRHSVGVVFQPVRKDGPAQQMVFLKLRKHLEKRKAESSTSLHSLNNFQS